MPNIEKCILIDTPVEKVFAFMAELIIHKMNQHESETVLANLKARKEAWPEPREAAGRELEVF